MNRVSKVDLQQGPISQPPSERIYRSFASSGRAFVDPRQQTLGTQSQWQPPRHWNNNMKMTIHNIIEVQGYYSPAVLYFFHTLRPGRPFGVNKGQLRFLRWGSKVGRVHSLNRPFKGTI